MSGEAILAVEDRQECDTTTNPNNKYHNTSASPPRSGGTPRRRSERLLCMQVHDKARKVTKTFICEVRVIEENMVYFRKVIDQQRRKMALEMSPPPPRLSAGVSSTAEEQETAERESEAKGRLMTINVNCDVDIFEWLVSYAQYASSRKLQEQQLSSQLVEASSTIQTPLLDTRHVVSVILSSQFLGMLPLTIEACGFLCAHLGEVLMSDVNLDCLPQDTIVRQLIIGENKNTTDSASPEQQQQQQQSGALTLDHLVHATLFVAAACQRVSLRDLFRCTNGAAGVPPASFATSTSTQIATSSRGGSPSNNASGTASLPHVLRKTLCPNRGFLTQLTLQYLCQWLKNHCCPDKWNYSSNSGGSSSSRGNHRLRWCDYCGQLFYNSHNTSGDASTSAAVPVQGGSDTAPIQRCHALKDSVLGPRGGLNEAHIASTRISGSSGVDGDSSSCNNSISNDPQQQPQCCTTDKCFCSGDLPIIEELLHDPSVGVMPPTAQANAAAAAHVPPPPHTRVFWTNVLDTCAVLLHRTQQKNAAQATSGSGSPHSPGLGGQYIVAGPEADRSYIDAAHLQTILSPKELLCWLLVGTVITMQPTRRTLERQQESHHNSSNTTNNSGSSGPKLTWASTKYAVPLLHRRLTPLLHTYADSGLFPLFATNDDNTIIYSNSNLGNSPNGNCRRRSHYEPHSPLDCLIILLRWCVPPRSERLLEGKCRKDAPPPSTTTNNKRAGTPNTNSNNNNNNNYNMETHTGMPLGRGLTSLLWEDADAKELFSYIAAKKEPYEALLRHKRRQRQQQLREEQRGDVSDSNSDNTDGSIASSDTTQDNNNTNNNKSIDSYILRNPETVALSPAMMMMDTITAQERRRFRYGDTSYQRHIAKIARCGVAGSERPSSSSNFNSNNNNNYLCSGGGEGGSVSSTSHSSNRRIGSGAPVRKSTSSNAGGAAQRTAPLRRVVSSATTHHTSTRNPHPPLAGNNNSTGAVVSTTAAVAAGTGVNNIYGSGSHTPSKSSGLKRPATSRTTDGNHHHPTSHK